MTHLAFDSHVLSYFLAANAPGYDPATDPERELAPQRLAAFRLAWWTKVYLLPVLEREVHPISGEAKRTEHLSWVYYRFLVEVLPARLDEGRVSRRTVQLETAHGGRNDCRLVAEAEEIDEIEMVATNDTDMIARLQPHTRLLLRRPADLWGELEIPRGTPPRWRPADGHPHEDAAWWRWE